MKAINTYTDAKELTKLMANAKRLGSEEVYNAAFKRRCELEGFDQTDPLHRDFHIVLAAYEGILEEKHGHRQPASYTRRKLKAKGVEQCLEDWALDTKETDGFRTLIDRGLINLTGEFVVTKYPDRFDSRVVEAASARLSRYRPE